MTHYGKIKSYDAATGIGAIVPEKGGDAIMFTKDDFRRDQVPTAEQRFGYETRRDDNGKSHAVNMRMSDTGSGPKADQPTS